MPYSRLDDALDGHPKVRAVGLEAFGLWCTAVIYCGHHLTDGRLDPGWIEERVPGRARRARLVGLLVEQRMLEPASDAGYWVHDYLDHNDSRATVQERRRRAAAKKAGQRAAQNGSMSPGDNGGDDRGDW